MTQEAVLLDFFTVGMIYAKDYSMKTSMIKLPLLQHHSEGDHYSLPLPAEYIERLEHALGSPLEPGDAFTIAMLGDDSGVLLLPLDKVSKSVTPSCQKLSPSKRLNTRHLDDRTHKKGKK